VDVAALLADGVELVEEQDARSGPGVVEDPLEPRGGLAEEAADQRLVPHDEERRRQRFRDRLGEGGLSVSRGADEQDAMPRFECVRAQHRRPMLFLDQLLAGAAGKVGQNEIGEPLAGRQLDQELPVLSAGTDEGRRAGTVAVDLQGVAQPVRQHVVALRPFLGDDRLGHGTRTRRVAARSRLHERNQEVAPCHVRSRSSTRSRS